MGEKQARIRCFVIDSHRNMSKKRREALLTFFCEEKEITIEQAREQVEFCDWYEKEYAVKWFEVVALWEGNVVGYLRCLRNADCVTEWLIGDVHVNKMFRHRHIATRMYEKAIHSVMEFPAAEKILTSVHLENENSIALHEKLGFENTRRKCSFPHLFFPEQESAFEKWLYQILPFPDNVSIETIAEKLLPVWQAYEKKCGNKPFAELENVIKQAKEGVSVFEIIWCGNRMVGFYYESDEKDILFNMQDDTLEIEEAKA